MLIMLYPEFVTFITTSFVIIARSCVVIFWTGIKDTTSLLDDNTDDIMKH